MRAKFQHTLEHLTENYFSYRSVLQALSTSLHLIPGFVFLDRSGTKLFVVIVVLYYNWNQKDSRA